MKCVKNWTEYERIQAHIAQTHAHKAQSVHAQTQTHTSHPQYTPYIMSCSDFTLLKCQIARCRFYLEFLNESQFIILHLVLLKIT